jgi:hypothetical protein
MTTLSDMLFDFIKEIIEAEHEAQDEATTLTDEALKQMVEEWIEVVKGKLI